MAGETRELPLEGFRLSLKQGSTGTSPEGRVSEGVRLERRV